MGTGIAICTNSVWFVLFFEFMYLAVYFPVMVAEARTMMTLFPADYPRYSEQVPMFFPGIPPKGSASKHDSSQSEVNPDGAGFDRSLYLKHREYRAAIGVVVVLSLLIAKAVILK